MHTSSSVFPVLDPGIPPQLGLVVLCTCKQVNTSALQQHVQDCDKVQLQGCIDERQLEMAMPQKQLSGNTSPIFAEIWKIIVPLCPIN